MGETLLFLSGLGTTDNGIVDNGGMYRGGNRTRERGMRRKEKGMCVKEVSVYTRLDEGRGEGF